VPVAQDLRHDHRAAEPALPPAIDASASAIERLRSSMPRAERSRVEPVMVPEGDEAPLSPNGAHASTATRRPAGEPSLEPRLSLDVWLGAATAETAKSSRLDFLFRSRQAAARSEASEPSRPAGPARSAPDAAAGPTRFAEAARSGTPSTPMPTLPMTPTIEPRPRDLGAKAVDPSGSVLKSGVVDGLAYTLYSDGSIEANLPDGTVRFGSIAELRAHIEKHP